MHTSIEDIILSNDRRGVSMLRPYLPPHYCSHAAGYILRHSGPVLITTGFYILGSGAPETDGPPGALALGSALRALGREVIYVAGAPLSGILAAHLERIGDPSVVVEFPLLYEDWENNRVAEKIVKKYEPSLIISVERCSPSMTGQYLNMRGDSISAYTPRIEYLFMKGMPSIGIGDGGNEIGMGNLAEIVRDADGLPDDPAAALCDCLVIASVSNWGGYGIAAALSLETGRNLLPPSEREMDCIRAMVDAGEVDGVSGDRQYSVDGFSLKQNDVILNELHRYIAGHLTENIDFWEKL